METKILGNMGGESIYLLLFVDDLVQKYDYAEIYVLRSDRRISEMGLRNQPKKTFYMECA